MKPRSTMGYAVTMAATLTGLAACSQTAPVAPAPPVVAAPPSAAAAAPEVVEAAPAPSVVRTQDDVQIFSGPSDRETPEPADPGAAAAVIDLNATANDEIGLYVTDGTGRTLYRFDKDKRKPARSACTGKCARMWPPLLVGSGGKVYPSGVNPQRVGYVERSGHDRQVTIDGQPIYYFSRDSKRGDLNGQGVQGTWFAVGPDGGRTRNRTEVIEESDGN